MSAALLSGADLESALRQIGEERFHLRLGLEVLLATETLGTPWIREHLALGDADAHSDVDFIVVTERDVTPEQQAELQALHQRLYALPMSWAQHLEGSYIPRQVLRRPDPDRRPLLYLDNGATEFALDSHDNTAVVRWSLPERGVVLAGRIHAS